MKTPLEAPPEQVKAETGVKEKPKAAPVIDTSKMSAGKAAALELAEAHGIRLMNAVVSRATFSSESSASIASSLTPLRAKKIAPAGESFLTELRELSARSRRCR